MQRPFETHKLPKLPFVVGYIGLIAAAGLIKAWAGEAPLHPGPLVAIATCIVFAAGLMAYPFAADYFHQREEELAERQRALETLARTTAETAEQIGIAAAGLHTVTELAEKNLKSAEQLPQKLQEKIHELSQRLAKTHAAEAEKLEAAAAKIFLAAADLAKLQAAPSQPGPTTPKLGEDRAAQSSPPAETAPKAEPVSSSIAPATGKVLSRRSPATADAEPAPKIDPPTLSAPPDSPIPAAVAEPAAAAIAPAALTAETTAAVAAALAAADALVMEVPHEELHTTVAPFAYIAKSAATPKPSDGGAAAPPPKRNKRAKPAAEEPVPATTPPALPPAEVTLTPGRDEGETPPKDTHDTNSPILELGISDDTALSPTGSVSNEATSPPFAFAKKSPAAPKRSEGGPPISKAPTSPPPATESALSSDGATRLLVTAYIGIGNKLFVRGDGPGLSPDKGVPLSFVSIGKWRWETADATAPVTVKLYKNDQQECAALGPVVLAPGHQHEVTADF